ALGPRRPCMRRPLPTALALVPLALAVLLPVQGCNCGCPPKGVRDKVLRLHLKTMREVLRQSCTDRKRCPESLEALVEQGYLGRSPADPTTKSSDPGFPAYREPSGGRGVGDVHSGAPGKGRDGRSSSEG